MSTLEIVPTFIAARGALGDAFARAVFVVYGHAISVAVKTARGDVCVFLLGSG